MMCTSVSCPGICADQQITGILKISMNLRSTGMTVNAGTQVFWPLCGQRVAGMLARQRELRLNCTIRLVPASLLAPEPLMRSSFRQIINRARRDKRFLVVPGAHDALSARLIQQIGFETYFIGGLPVAGARHRLPDLGLKGFGDMSAAVRDIMAACDLPVFVDADDGYGDVK